MSIHPHSRPDTFFIFCVGQDVRRINAFKKNMVYHGVTIKPLVGMYKGQPEHSFIAHMDDFNTVSPWLIEEESILHIHSFDARDVPNATLLFLKDGRKEELGKMRPVSQKVALARDSWTYDPTYKNYYVTEK